MELPDFYDNLPLSLAELHRVIAQGVRNRKSAAHHPVVASVDEHGAPQQRVMILRDFNADTRQLRFHTDARSGKIQHIRSKSKTSVLIYDEAAKVQIRLSGFANVDDGELSDAAWNDSTAFARRCYMAENAPGSFAESPTSGLPIWIAGKQPEEKDLVAARENFAAVLIRITMMEWLYLANAGHRRARWHWNEQHQHWSGNWLIP